MTADRATEVGLLTTQDTPVEYARALREAVGTARDDDEVLAEVLALPGGVDRLVDFFTSGMAAAFDSTRAAGETGVVQIVIQAEGRAFDLWLRIGGDACLATRRGSDADCVIRVPLPVFLRIAFKTTTGSDAFLQGQVSATGDVVLATALDDWFEAPDVAAAAPPASDGGSEPA